MNKDIMTKAVRLGEYSPKSISTPKTVPIYMSSSYAFETVDDLEDVYSGKEEGYVYSRVGNPGQDTLKAVMAGIEDGEDVEVYSSGMAAIAMSIMANVSAGDHIVASNVLYGGSYSLLKEELKRFDVEVSFIDIENDDIAASIKDNTKILYMETISNPLMEVVDIREICNMCHEKGVKVIIDNTFATPSICQPLKHGADIVVYSATKYLCGHSDVMAGIVIGDKETVAKIRYTGSLLGPTMSPFDSWVLTRSLRTLDLRVKKHSENALELAKYFENHEKVEKVYYPGLESSKYHELSKELFNTNHFGGMLSVDLVGGEQAVCDIIEHLESIKFVPSLAGVATSVSFPVRTSHRALTDEELKESNISKGLLRISTGLENISDIIGEFDRALAKL